MTFDYDAIVVGGRVAGASTAMLLARAGHRVLIVERASMPSDTVSTHAILRTGVLQLQRWGVLDRVIDSGAPPIRDITLGFGEERISFQVRPDHGVDTLYAPRRTVLDPILVDAAVASGAEFRGRTTMTGLIRDGERVCGIEFKEDGNTSSATARFVIGADGYRSRVADLVGASTRLSHTATNTVNYAYYEGIDNPGFWFQFTPGVNAGLVPTNDEQCLVFVGRPTRLRDRFHADPDVEFHRLLASGGSDLAGVVSDGVRIGNFRGTNGLPGFIRQAWGPGWALVGDAGYTKDPISAHGISDGLRDAELCARAIDLALHRPEEEQTALTQYETTRDRLSLAMFHESRALAQFEWSAPEASRRMRLISDQVRAECEALIGLPAWDALDHNLVGV